MRPIVWCLCSLLLACERDPKMQLPELAPTVAAPAPSKAAPIAAPTPAPLVASTSSTATTPTTPTPPAPAIAIPHAPPVEHTARRAPAPNEVELPTPPSDDPREYATWWREISPGQRKRITAFCRKHPTDYEAECGGIGPLHIPVPPMPRLPRDAPDEPSRSTFASLELWQASLSAAQRTYVTEQCRGGEAQPSSDLCGLNTPLVVSFDGGPITFARGASFAFAPGTAVATDWPTSATPWIALDRDHSGTIDSGAELFGSNTALADGSLAANGFAALAALDTNHDGRIDASDADFAALVLWADRDGDGKSSPAELTPLASVIVSISLADHVDLRCDARGNCEGERASIVWRDAKGATHEGSVVDVYLPNRQ